MGVRGRRTFYPWRECRKRLTADHRWKLDEKCYPNFYPRIPGQLHFASRGIEEELLLFSRGVLFGFLS
jgi:hypothetical protein